MDVTDADMRYQWKNESEKSWDSATTSATKLYPSALPQTQNIPDAAISTPPVAINLSSCLLDCRERFTGCHPPHDIDSESVCDIFTKNSSLFLTKYGCSAECRVDINRRAQAGEDDVCSIISRCQKSASTVTIDQGHSHSEESNGIEQIATIILSSWPTESVVTSLSKALIPGFQETNPQTRTIPSITATTMILDILFSHTPSQIPSAILTSDSSLISTKLSQTILASTSITPSPITGLITPSALPSQLNPSSHPSLWDTLSPAARILILLGSISFFLLLLLGSIIYWHRRQSRQRPLSTSSGLSFSDIGIPITEYCANTPPGSDGIHWPEEAVLTGEAREMKMWTREYERESGSGTGSGRRKMVLGGELVRGEDGRWVREGL